jgi:hypothetical protein
MANTVDHEMKLKVLKYDLDHAKRRILTAVADLRYVCDDVEGDINIGRQHNHSNTTSATELFYAIGRYNTLIEAIKVIEGEG